MRRLVQSFLHHVGWHLGRFPFHTPAYLRHTARRLEHLATLELPTRGLRVLEVGSGAGDFTHFYLDRGCSVTVTDARQSNVSYLRRRYPGCNVRVLDLDRPGKLDGETWEIVHCYGVLYHLEHPTAALEYLSGACTHWMVLETRVVAGDAPTLSTLRENHRVPSLSLHGCGCRPTRSWVFGELRRHFAHAYTTRTQPNHPDFPTDWKDPALASRETCRAVFVASHQPMDLSTLQPTLTARQELCP